VRRERARKLVRDILEALLLNEFRNPKYNCLKEP